MFQTQLTVLLLCLLPTLRAGNPVDIVIEREYYGEYTSRRSEVSLRQLRATSTTCRDTPGSSSPSSTAPPTAKP